MVVHIHIHFIISITEPRMRYLLARPISCHTSFRGVPAPMEMHPASLAPKYYPDVAHKTLKESSEINSWEESNVKSVTGAQIQ